MRADAASNRARILESAEQIMRKEGVVPSPDAISSHAKVARTTYFRNFPDRSALMLALLDRSIEQLEEAIAAREESQDLLHEVLELIAVGAHLNLGFVTFWFDDHVDDEGIAGGFKTGMARVERLLQRPIDRARSIGLCRVDLVPSDVILVVPMLAGAIRGSPVSGRAAVARRALDLVWSGLSIAPTKDQSTGR